MPVRLRRPDAPRISAATLLPRQVRVEGGEELTAFVLEADLTRAITIPQLGNSFVGLMLCFRECKISAYMYDYVEEGAFPPDLRYLVTEHHFLTQGEHPADGQAVLDFYFNHFEYPEFHDTICPPLAGITINEASQGGVPAIHVMWVTPTSHD